MKVALIVVAGSIKQNQCFWPSYFSADAGIDHDLIVVHRNMAHVPSIVNNCGSVILENKIYPVGELPHKAFGAYREYWRRYQNSYDIFGFISDDVVVKSDGWVAKAVSLLSKFNKLGFVGTQIFNGLDGQYPHPSHCRAPVWFAKSSALKDIKWKFDSDHGGEMGLADQFLEAGYYGAQVGNKIDIAYDALENGGHFVGDHISAIMEKALGHDISTKFSAEEVKKLNDRLLFALGNHDDHMKVTSPHPHIGERKIISQLQPFHGLVYDKSIELAKNDAKQYSFNIWLLKDK